MVVGDARSAMMVVIGFAKAAGMGELQTDEKAIERSEGILMRIGEGAEEGGETGAIGLNGKRLVGIRAAIVANGGGFATPDEFRAAAAEVLPTAEGVRGG